jgi:hypothetical protein
MGELQTLMQERANNWGRQWKEHKRQLALSRLNMLINVITMTSIKMSDVEYPDILSSYNDKNGGWFLRSKRQERLAHVLKSGHVKLNY